jgi:hypothetical protein
VTDNLTTDLDTLYHQHPETLAHARQVVESSGRDDVTELLEMLGLVEAKPRPRRGTCPACKQPYRAGRRECRQVDCERGPRSRVRGVKR